jgi:hypothetical protein
VTVDSVWRGAGNFGFLKFLLQPAGRTGRKFDPGRQNRRRGEIWFMLDRDRIFPADDNLPPSARRLLEDDGFEQDRHIAHPADVSLVYAKSAGPPELVLDDWH